MFNKNFLIMFCMIFLMGITFVSAVPPVTTEFVGSIGLDVEANLQDYYRINEGAEIHIFVFNKSDGGKVISPTVTCQVELTNRNGTVLLEGFATADGDHFHMTRNASVVTIAGSYAVTIVCNTSEIAGYKTGFFEATEGGIGLDQSRSHLIIGLLAILVFLLFLSLYAVFNVENYIGKFAMYWVSHLLFILIAFVGWQIGVEALLGMVALTGVFKIMFWVLVVAVVPMVFLSMAWIIYLHAFNEHFQKLVDKGMDTESAFKMAKRKSGGWFNGR